MIKECFGCNTEIIDIQKVYIEGIEVCPYCFNILDIPIIENKNMKDLIDTILSENIVKDLVSNSYSEKNTSIVVILFTVFLMVFSIIFPLVVSLFI